jgi:hypothetical protein
MRDINAPYHYRSWSLKTPTTTWIEGYNVDKKISWLDVFLMMFPPKQLTSVVTYTNRELEDLKKRKTTKSEILKFFGFVVLCTKYEFSSQASGLKLLQQNMRKLLPLVALEWQGCALMTCGDAFILVISQR